MNPIQDLTEALFAFAQFLLFIAFAILVASACYILIKKLRWTKAVTACTLSALAFWFVAVVIELRG